MGTNNSPILGSPQSPSAPRSNTLAKAGVEGEPLSDSPIIPYDPDTHFLPPPPPPVLSVFGRIGDVVAQGGDYAAFYAPLGHTHPWSEITGTPTTLAGYGITDAQPLDADLTTVANITPSINQYYGTGPSSTNKDWFDLPTPTWSAIIGKPTTLAGYGITDAYTKAQSDANYAPIAHSHTFASLTGKPTTLTGYGITDAQPLDSDLTAIAALTTTAYGRGFLPLVDAAAARTYIGAQAAGSYEPALGNPSVNGYILSSTTAGVRSWIVPPAGGGGTIGGSTGATDNAILRADGTGGATLQTTGVTIDDTNNFSGFQRMYGTGSGNYIGWGDIVFGDALGTGAACIGFNANQAIKFKDNVGYINFTLKSPYVSALATFASNYVVGWSSTANNADAATDTALARNAAGVVEINNGTAAAYRDLKLRTLFFADGTSMSTAAGGGGGGNVSNSGTPTAGQIAAWTDSTHIQGIANTMSQWDGGATGLVAATGRTSLGLGTAAQNNTGDFALAAHTHTFASLTSKPTTLVGYGITDAQPLDADLTTWAGLTPSANFQTMVTHTFAQMRTDLGLVIGTNVQAWDTDLDFWATKNQSTDLLMASSQTFAVSDAGTTSNPTVFTLRHNTSGTPLALFGTTMLWQMQSDTTINRTAGDVSTLWTDPADATRTSNYRIRTVKNASFVNSMTLFGASGGVAFGTTTDPGTNSCNLGSGGVYKVNGAQIGYGDLAGTFASVQANPTNPTSTVSATGVMMGLGVTAKMTPAVTGKVLCTILGMISNTLTTNTTLQGYLNWGTGTVPTNGSASAGTGVGPGFIRSGTYATASSQTPFCLTGIVQATVGVQFWIDILLAGSGGTTGISTLNVTMVELP